MHTNTLVTELTLLADQGQTCVHDNGLQYPDHSPVFLTPHSARYRAKVHMHANDSGSWKFQNRWCGSVLLLLSGRLIEFSNAASPVQLS